jgi:PH (Pleckstrin Homology) domain-containing protein
MRQSHIILVLRLVGLDLLITVLYLLFRIPSTLLHMINVSNSFLLGVNIIGIAYFVVITLVEIVLSSWIVLSWANEEWEIKEGVIYHRRGVFRMHEDAYSLKQIASTTLRQGFIGKLFNYGTIRIFSPLLKQDYYLTNIHNPREIMRTLEDEVAGTTEKARSHVLYKKKLLI